ncbi:sigma factor-like helix-turn-helix DNA-binding protein [Actinacidiphila acididurans]|uniref:RNA polymerase subunit sigma-24 n=1 Tax=Actinacidiphila acididurans TaxID=2784346 RepID=A0ABS2TV26_9ACTN|nr:sigma factor-like helix-turn-helix DNA-binding protein [Actinacidiphila acididurans]MBM9507197.1 RNA polymerase subunit sigma-24 [Actinacidiphila acididurans]
MDGLRNEETGRQDGAGTATGRPDPAVPPLAGFADDPHLVRLFGAVYRMLGSAQEAEQIVREARPGAADADAEAYDRLVHQVFGVVVRRAEAAVRGRREAAAGTWLPEPVLTAGGILGPLPSAEARESVSMARLVLLERLQPTERAAYVLREVFGYGPADIAGVLGLAEARCGSLLRRARQRVRESESVFRSGVSEQQRRRIVDELLRAVLAEERAALEELLTDDVVAWTDGGWQPEILRRPVLGAVKVSRFLAGLLARAPEGTGGTIAEVNGGLGVVGVVGDRIVGVLSPEFGERGLVGIRTVAVPARLAYFSRQWAARAED